MSTENNLKVLIDAALEVRKYAAAKYSGFNVGAALEDENGNIWTGCNVESSSYGLSICAERVALTKALSEGATGFKRIIVTASGPGLTYPCGACLQLLNDYALGIEVIIYDSTLKHSETRKLIELYPYPFTDSTMSGA